MWNPFNRYSYYDVDWKKVGIIGGSAGLLILIIILIILLATGVIKFEPRDEVDPSDIEDLIYEEDKPIDNEALTDYYFISDFEGKDIRPSLYYEATVEKCRYDGTTIELVIRLSLPNRFNVSDILWKSIQSTEYLISGVLEDKALMTYKLLTGDTYVFDANKGSAGSLGGLRTGDNIIVYIDENNVNIPLVIIRGTGYRALRVGKSDTTDDYATKITSIDNSIKLIATAGATTKDALDVTKFYSTRFLNKGDIVIFKDDNTTSINKKYLTDKDEVVGDKYIQKSGVIKETGGVKELRGEKRYGYIDYTTSELYVIRNS